ncbi:right-handed parallel beta-helix repeat-containing protein, partial [Candidatus Omnitrophota bacterium]
SATYIVDGVVAGKLDLIRHDTQYVAQIPPDLIEEDAYVALEITAFDLEGNSLRYIFDPAFYFRTFTGLIAEISSPIEQGNFYGQEAVTIIGTAGDDGSGGFVSYSLEYGEGINPDEWIEIPVEDPNSPVDNDVMGVFDLSGLTPNIYTVRLVVTGQEAKEIDAVLVRYYNPDFIHVPLDYQTIQDALDECQDGDTIVVLPGEYFIEAGYGLRSAAGADRTMLSVVGGGSMEHVCFRFSDEEGPDSIVDGFTIINGYISCLYSSPTIKNNVFKISAPSLDTAIEVLGSGANPVIKNNFLTVKSDDPHSGILMGSLISAENSSHPIIENNTLTTGEGGEISAGTIFLRNSTAEVKNTIIQGVDGDPVYLMDGATIEVTYSDIQGGWPGAGNIDVDPLFIDLEEGDFHLQDFLSPCIDAGDPADDYSQEPHYNGRRINMGAYGNTAEAARTRKPGPTIPNIGR